MQLSRIFTRNMANKALIPQTHNLKPSWDVFINHRGVDTKRTIAKLLHHHLSSQGLHPFLDNESMKPGDKLLDTIDHAIKDCKLGIVIFSPTYCESSFCLHELAMMMEYKKRIVPIFCDIEPHELGIKNDGKYAESEVEKFKLALEVAKDIVGLTFHTNNSDWLDFLTRVTDAVLRNIEEVN